MDTDRLFLLETPTIRAAFLLLTALLVPAAAVIARRRGAALPGPMLFGCALAFALAVTLTPAPAGGQGLAGVCTSGHTFLTHGPDTQWYLNLLLTAPAAFLAARLTGRALPVLLGSVLLSLATELTQAAIPTLARACDVDDLTANVIGAALAVLAARLWERRRRPPRVTVPPARGPLYACATACALLAVVLATMVRPEPDARAAPELSPGRRAAVERAARDLWGESVPITRIAWDGDTESGVVVSSGSGFTSFAWPSLTPLRGTRSVEADGPATGAAVAADEQVERAQRYMRAHFPWAGRAGTTSWPVGDTGRRLVSWRHRVDGVLMPMRLDVVVDRAGAVASFAAVDEPDPTLPPALVDEARARAAAQAARRGRTFGVPILLAVRSTAGWRPAWSFPTEPTNPSNTTAPSTSPDLAAESPRTVVDAVTGAVLP
ncbi:VanZ family protein [Streptomyces sp. NPDC090077]|uniref:VanZ family protein n=1 Tax=Streptomyces sp. NPDC090077 TaxID=3365938 RepID=UPI00382DCFB3